jgi:hypothetical protein
MNVLVALLPFGLLEILLVLLGVFLGIASMISFGHPSVDNFRSRCPACHADALRCIEAGASTHRYQLRVFRCDRCGSAYQEALDGTLVELPVES